MAQITTQRMQSYMTRVFSWMSGALGLTALTSYTVAHVPSVAQAVMANPAIIIMLIIAQLGLVVALSGFLHRLSVEAASICFWSYAALTGVVFSGLFFVYTDLSIFSTFLVASGMFGAMAVYGATTQSDLTGMGSFLRMALFGLIITMLVNWFLQSPAVYYAVSVIGVILFSGLTAYDVQQLRMLAERMEDQGSDDATKITIVMALKLYLDFINLFIFLLRLTGNRKR